MIFPQSWKSEAGPIGRWLKTIWPNHFFSPVEHIPRVAAISAHISLKIAVEDSYMQCWLHPQPQYEYFFSRTSWPIWIFFFAYYLTNMNICFRVLIQFPSYIAANMHILSQPQFRYLCPNLPNIFKLVSPFWSHFHIFRCTIWSWYAEPKYSIWNKREPFFPDPSQPQPIRAGDGPHETLKGTKTS